MNPRLALRRWREQERCSGASLAAELGCSRGFIYELEQNYSGKDTVPGLALAREIERVTGIPAREWDRLAQVKHQRPKKGAA